MRIHGSTFAWHGSSTEQLWPPTFPDDVPILPVVGTHLSPTINSHAGASTSQHCRKWQELLRSCTASAWRPPRSSKIVAHDLRATDGTGKTISWPLSVHNDLRASAQHPGGVGSFGQTNAHQSIRMLFCVQEFVTDDH